MNHPGFLGDLVRRAFTLRPGRPEFVLAALHTSLGEGTRGGQEPLMVEPPDRVEGRRLHFDQRRHQPRSAWQTQGRSVSPEQRIFPQWTR
jgi:hypothetical protein